MRTPAGDLDNLMNLLALTNSIAWLLIPVCSKGLDVKSGEKMFAKSVYLARTFVEASLAIKAAIWGLRWTSSASGGELGDATELSDPTLTT